MTDTPVRRLQLAFDLFDAGLTLMRQNLRRRMPNASDEDVQAAVRAWLRERPGAEHGDAAGRPVAWPPRRA